MSNRRLKSPPPPQTSKKAICPKFACRACSQNLVCLSLHPSLPSVPVLGRKKQWILPGEKVKNNLEKSKRTIFWAHQTDRLSITDSSFHPAFSFYHPILKQAWKRNTNRILKTLHLHFYLSVSWATSNEPFPSWTFLSAPCWLMSRESGKAYPIFKYTDIN